MTTTGQPLLAIGEAYADMPLRLLNLFAVNGVAFDSVTIDRDQERYVVRIWAQDIPPARRETMVEKIRTLVSVHDARWESAPIQAAATPR